MLLIDIRIFYAAAIHFCSLWLSVAADYSMVKRDLDIVGSILYLSSLVVVSVAAVVVQI